MITISPFGVIAALAIVFYLAIFTGLHYDTVYEKIDKKERFKYLKVSYLILLIFLLLIAIQVSFDYMTFPSKDYEIASSLMFIDLPSFAIPILYCLFIVLTVRDVKKGVYTK